MGKLTVKGIEKILRDKQAGRYADGDGLYLHVRDGGSWAWVYRYAFGGKRTDLGLGSTYTLEQARTRAAVLRQAVKGGRDPTEERDREKARLSIPTFKEAAKACHVEQAKGWDAKHAAAWLATLEQHAFPTLGKLRVDMIEPSHIADTLRPIWLTTPVVARKVRQRIGAVLNFSYAHKWRATEAPVKSVTILLSRQPKGGNFEAMPWAAVPDWMARLREQPETIARLALQFTVLTAARSKETRFAKWGEIDLDARDWNRPAEHMKRRIPHTISLSDAALAVLEQAARYRTTKADCLIFPGKSGKPLSDMTMAKALRTSGETATVHGFRSTFKDWASEQMGHIPDAVSEAALSHAVSDAVIAAYRRTPFNAMRRQLLDAWASYVSGGGKVVRLSAAS